MAGSASIGGIISGFNVDDIIAQMTSLQRAPQIRMNGRKAELQKRKDAWDSMQVKLQTLQQAAADLGRASTFQLYSAASSNTGILTTTTSPDAIPGSYRVTVTATAQSHQIKSAGFADATSASLGTGTVTLQVGSGAPATLTLDPTNNTLGGLRDAINRSGMGITASIINDGDAAKPYRLVLTAGATGSANQIAVTPALSGGNALGFTTLREARNASVTLGEGAGAITVSKSSNTITDLIQGVTLNLLDADAAKNVNVTVTRDNDLIHSSIQRFADTYNAFRDLAQTQAKYDPETMTGGPLLGDYTLQSMDADINTLLGNPVKGTASTMNLLSQAGITLGSDGKLAIDSAKLDAALASDTAGVSKLFAEVGEPTDAGVRYLGCTKDTKPSDTAGYAVVITQAAARARVTAGAAQTGALLQNEALTLNGTTLVLTAGMTQADVVAAINAKTGTTGITAKATGADGTGAGSYLTLERSQYGSAYAIRAISTVSNGGTLPAANTSGLGNVQVTDAAAGGETGTGAGASGKNVAGTINGEAAAGSGQILTGAVGNPNTAGLQLQITAATTGAHGKVVFTRGVGGTLDRLIERLTKGTDSAVEGAKTTLQEQIDDITAEMQRSEERLTRYQERLREQFNRMESALSTLQGQSSQLSQQIAGLSGTSTSSK